MSQRILHIIDSLAHGGTAQQLSLLAEGLARQGFDVHVAALDHGGPHVAELAAGRIPATVIGRRFALDPLALARLRRLVTRLRPDVIHTWNRAAALYGCPAAGRVGRRRATRPRFVLGQYRIDRWKSGMEWFVDRRLGQRADRLAANSRAVRAWCVANGLQAEKFALIPSGAPPARPSDLSREELLRKLKLPAETRLIGVVGRLAPENRVKDLIWAADLLRVLHGNLRLLVIGDGPIRSQLERYARLASDLELIQFLGDRGDVWRIMPHLDALWNGSDNRGQSAAILEAMAAGVPVVASDVAVNRELVVEGETGYLVPVGSRAGRAARARHTDHILSDAALAARLAATARQWITDRFGMEQLVSEYAKMYLEGG